MDKKSKTRGVAAGAQTKEIQKKKQSEQFVKIARELGSEESGRAFEKAVTKILSAKKSDS